MPKLEPQIEFLVATFSHELAKHLEFSLPFTAHVRTSLEPHLDLTSTLSPDQLLILLRRSALPNPCSRRANLTFCTCLLAQGWQSTPMVSILNKRSCCWVLQLRPRSDFGRLVLARSKPLGGGRTLSDRARRVLHL